MPSSLWPTTDQLAPMVPGLVDLPFSVAPQNVWVSSCLWIGFARLQLLMWPTLPQAWEFPATGNSLPLRPVVARFPSWPRLISQVESVLGIPPFLYVVIPDWSGSKLNPGCTESGLAGFSWVGPFEPVLWLQSWH